MSAVAWKSELIGTPISTIIFASTKAEAMNRAYEEFNFYCPDIERYDVKIERAGQYDVYLERGKITMRHLIFQLGWTWFCDCCNKFVSKSNVGLVWDSENVVYCNECSQEMNRDVID